MAHDTHHVSVLAFDFGTHNIGVAFGQSLTHSASPLKTLKAHAGKPNWDEIKQLIQQWQPDYIAVGLPVHLDGKPTNITKQARKFASRLAHQLDQPVGLIDERLTSEMAESELNHSNHWPQEKKKSKKNKNNSKDSVDAMAAAIIAKGWLSQFQTHPESIETLFPHGKTPPTQT